MRRITKLFNTKALSIDEANKRVTFKFSDNQKDRMGEIVDQKSWNFKSYMSNPLILWGHNPDEPENVLGTARSLEIAEDGSYSTVEVQFDTEINPKAALVFNQVKAGTLRTTSAGFINHSEEVENDIPVLKDNELLEISVVPIPANPRAVALSLKDGTINRKDAKWLMDGMRKEADMLEAQLKEQSNEDGDKPKMDEIKAQIATLTEAVSKLTEQNAALQTTLDELKPPAETEEEKQAREAKEAAAKQAADDATAAEAEKNKTPPAKDGDDDQSGAGAEEFDPDAELTPEQQAEVETALADLVPAA